MNMIKNKKSSSETTGGEKPKHTVNSLRKIAENKLISGSTNIPDNPDNLNTEEVTKLIHELKVHQIELEMQNEELRRAQSQLEISREKYFDLYDLAPVGYLTLGRNGSILEANLTASNMLGLSRGNLVKQSFSQFIYKEDLPVYFDFKNKSLDSSSLQSYEIRINRKQGNPFWVMVDINKLQTEDSSQLSRVIISNIDEAKRDREKVSLLLQENELILREVHHRIKNNLNTVMSILSLHANSSDNASVIEALQDAKGRVNTMLILYNKLYTSRDVHEASLKDYLTPLISEIVGLFPNLAKIKVITKFDKTKISVQLLPSLGIIVNELLTNIAKYAFEGRDSGQIKITAELNNKTIRLVISDNGVGFPETVDIRNSNGLGLQLVNLLVQQHNGSLKVEVNNGTTIILELDT